MLNATDKATWESFFEVAEQFQQLAPWAWMEDRHIFRVFNAPTNDFFYCSILGNGGEVFGINLYPGEAGLATLLALYEGVGEYSEVPPLAIYDQDCFRLDLTEAEYMGEDDQEIYDQLGRSVAKGDALNIVLRRAKAGLVPMPPSSEEVAQVTAALISALEVAKNYQDNVSYLNQLADMNTLPSRHLDEQGQAVIEYVSMPEVELRWPTAPLPELTLRSITQLPVQEQVDILTLMHIPGQIVQESPEDAAYFPLTNIWVNSTEGNIESFDLAHPEEMKTELLSRIATHFTEQGFRPNQIAVNDVLVAKAIESFCQKLNMDLLIAPAELINELYFSMMQISGQLDEMGFDFEE